MPGGPHEVLLMLADELAVGLVDVVRHATGAELATGVVVDRLRAIDKAVPQLVGPEHAADRAFELLAHDRVVGAMIVEAQESPLDDKHLTWPL